MWESIKGGLLPWEYQYRVSPWWKQSVTISVTSTQKMWTLVAPQVRKWSFFFNQTFRISYWYLVEQIETLRGGVGAIWKKHIFFHRTPYFWEYDDDDDDAESVWQQTEGAAVPKRIED